MWPSHPYAEERMPLKTNIVKFWCKSTQNNWKQKIKLYYFNIILILAARFWFWFDKKTIYIPSSKHLTTKIGI
jgi:hypothetical protein